MLKKAAVLVVSLTSVHAFAMGGIDCSSPSNPELFSVSTGLVLGSPLAEDLRISLAKSGETFQIPRDRVVQYKNTPTELYVLAADADYIEESLILDAKADSRSSHVYRGTLKLLQDGKKKTYRVVCRQSAD